MGQADLEALAKQYGFDNAEEMDRLIKSFELKITDQRMTSDFKSWALLDGTKQGLLKLMAKYQSNKGA